MSTEAAESILDLGKHILALETKVTSLMIDNEQLNIKLSDLEYFSKLMDKTEDLEKELSAAKEQLDATVDILEQTRQELCAKDACIAELKIRKTSLQHLGIDKPKERLLHARPLVADQLHAIIELISIARDEPTNTDRWDEAVDDAFHLLVGDI